MEVKRQLYSRTLIKLYQTSRKKTSCREFSTKTLIYSRNKIVYHTYYELCKTAKILECLRVFQLLRAKNDVVNYCSFKLKTVLRHPNCSYV